MAERRQTYGAPRGTSVKLLTVLSLAVTGFAGYVLLGVSQARPALAYSVLALLVALILACGLFAIRGYELRGRTLVIRRVVSDKPISLSGLRSVAEDAVATRRSIRLLGKGGLFGFTGLFWSRSLGRYRAFVTDPAKAVVLKYEDRVIVVSPDPPSDFVAAVREACRLDART